MTILENSYILFGKVIQTDIFYIFNEDVLVINNNISVIYDICIDYKLSELTEHIAHHNNKLDYKSIVKDLTPENIARITNINNINKNINNEYRWMALKIRVLTNNCTKYAASMLDIINVS